MPPQSSWAERNRLKPPIAPTGSTWAERNRLESKTSNPAPTSPTEKPGFWSRALPAAKSIAEGAVGQLYMGMNPGYGSQVMGQGLIEPIMEAYNDPTPRHPHARFGRAALQMAQVDPNALEEDLSAGNYWAAGGDVAPAIVAGLVAKKVGGNLRGRALANSLNVPTPPPIVPEIPTVGGWRGPAPYDVPFPPSKMDVPLNQSPWPNEKVPPKPQPYDVELPPSPYNVPGPPKQIPAVTGLTTPDPSPLFPEGGPSYLRGPRGPAPKLLGTGEPTPPPGNRFADSLGQPNTDLNSPSTVDIFGQSIPDAAAVQGRVDFPPVQPGFNPALRRPGTSMPLGKPIMEIPPAPVLPDVEPIAPTAGVGAATGARVSKPGKVVKAPQAKVPKLNVKELTDEQLQQVIMSDAGPVPAAMKELATRTKRRVKAAKAEQVAKLVAETKARAGQPVAPIVPPVEAVDVPVRTLPDVEPPKPVVPPTVEPVTPVKSPVPLADVTLASEPPKPVAPVVETPTPPKPKVAAPPKANISALSKALEDANTAYQKARREFRGYKSPLEDETKDPKWVEINNALNVARKQVIDATKAKAAALTKPKEVVSAPVVGPTKSIYAGMEWERTGDNYTSGKYSIQTEKSGSWSLLEDGKVIKKGSLNNLKATAAELSSRPKGIDLSGKTREELIEIARTADDATSLAVRQELKTRREAASKAAGSNLASGFGSLQDAPRIIKQEFDDWRVLKELPENQAAFEQFLNESPEIARLMPNWSGKPKEVQISTKSIPNVTIPKEEPVGFGTRTGSKRLNPLDYPDLPTAEKIKIEGPSVSNIKRGPVERVVWKDREGQRIGRRLEPEGEFTPQPTEPRPIPKPPVLRERTRIELDQEKSPLKGLSNREIVAKVGKEAEAQAKLDAIKAAEERGKAAARAEIKAKKDARLAERTAKMEERKAKVAEKKAARAKTVDEVIAQKRATSKVDNATFSAAVKNLPKRFKSSTLYRTIYEPSGVSTLTKLKRMGEKGSSLAKTLRDERTESNRLGGQEAVKVRKVRRMLSNAEQTEVVKLLDGQKPLNSASSEKVVKAYRMLRESTEYLGNLAVQAGVKMKDSKGNTVPFQKLAGEYFPHRYPEELFKDPVALKEKLLRHGKDAQGRPLSPNAVDAMVKQITEKGERFSSPQHSRDFNLPGYLESLDALEAHQYELAQAITRTKRFGALDMADAGSTISQLVKNAEDPVRAKMMVNDYLERNEFDPDRSGQQKWYNRIVKAEVASKLSQFAITNMGDLAGTNAALGIRNTHKAIADTLMDRHGSADIAAGTGAHAILRKELLNDVKAGKFLSKAYGTAGTEKAIRTVAALAGRVEVQKLFAKAKKDPRFKKTLADFVDGDVNDVLKQEKLTKEQIDFGGGRGVEISSGIPDKLSLSKAMFADNPMMRLPFLFKRFAFMNTRNMVDVVKRQPTAFAKVKKAGTILAAYQVAGEVIGDTKSAITGLVSGDVEEEIKGRGEYINSENWKFIGKTVGSKALDRIIANYLQAALFGVVGDVTESVVRKKLGKVSGTIGGPVLSDADEFAQVATDLAGGDYKSLGRAAARRVPYVGTGLAKRWAKESKSGSGGLGSLSGPSLRGLN